MRRVVQTFLSYNWEFAVVCYSRKMRGFFCLQAWMGRSRSSAYGDAGRFQHPGFLQRNICHIFIQYPGNDEICII